VSKSQSGPAPLKMEMVGIDTLRPDPHNARKHGGKNMESIKNSLREFGQQMPIVVNEDNVVIAGNARLEAAKSLGWKNIVIVRTDLAGKRAAAFAIADNRTSELADWDEQQLADTLRAIADDQSSMATGFSADDFSALVERLKYDSMMMTGGNSFFDTVESLDALDEDEPALPTVPGEDGETNIIEDSEEHTCPKCGHKFSN
jgi:hypothetical protein